MDFSNTILIDRKINRNLKNLRRSQSVKIYSMFVEWFFDYQNAEVRRFLSKLKSLKIDYKCFLPVLLDEHKKLEDIIYPEKLIINNNILNSYQIKNIN